MPDEPGGRAMPPPADPWATINRPADTVFLGDPDKTARLTPVAPTVHLGPPAAPLAQPLAQPQPEVRFGPGVPVAPVAAPQWPGPRPRPLWRRLVSVVSSLLTLALVVVVGFALWQRLSPLEVEGVTVAVPTPAGSRCDVTVDVVATVRTNGRSGTIRYQWFRSGAAPGPVLTEQVGRGQRTATLTLRWAFSGNGSTTETAKVNIVEPSPLQAETPVVYRCRQP